MSYSLEFTDDPVEFLAAAGPLLEANPVPSTVVASATARLRRDGLPEDPPAPLWWLVVRDREGAVVGAGMRTTSTPPYRPYLLAMPDEAARDLARVLHERGEQVPGINGALPAVLVFAEEIARLTGDTVRIAEEMRLHEVTELVPVPAAPGVLRKAGEDDIELVLDWFDAFDLDAAEQAGRADPHPAPIESRETTLGRIVAGEIWFWESPGGVRVHVTAFNPPSFGVARIGPVYTPREHRGNGYAAVAVAEVSRMLLDCGHRVCLFTDQANPTSNALYERLGYRPVVDMANLVIDPPVREDGSGEPPRA